MIFCARRSVGVGRFVHRHADRIPGVRINALRQIAGRNGDQRGSSLRDRQTRIVPFAIRINRLSVNVHANRASIEILGDLVEINAVRLRRQRRDGLGSGRLADRAGEGLFAFLRARRWLRYNALVPPVVGIMHGCILKIVITALDGNTVPFCFRAAGIIHILQRSTVVKSIASYARHAVRNFHACQAAAVLKHFLADSRDAVRDFHTRQTHAIKKRIIADTRYTVRDCYARQTDLTDKRMVSDARHAGFNDNGFYLRCCPR